MKQKYKRHERRHSLIPEVCPLCFQDVVEGICSGCGVKFKKEKTKEKLERSKGGFTLTKKDIESLRKKDTTAWTKGYQIKK